MDKVLVYKKYGNRRLYDTEKSSYVTLDDIAHVIREGRQVQIMDAKTKEDVTSFILTQILLEASRTKNFLMPVPLLHLLIQSSGNLLNEFFKNYLEQIIKNYMAYQSVTDQQFKKWLDIRTGYPNMPSFSSLMDLFPNLSPPLTEEKGKPDRTPRKP
jgi:polyhydroxyalkanoate synthesis repressor PhaR